mgnify:CR=1 FL=1
MGDHEANGHQRGRLPAWMRVTLVLLAVIAGGLAVWLYATDSGRTRSGDMAAVREVSIVASNFRSWPETAHQIARTNLYHPGEEGARPAAQPRSSMAKVVNTICALPSSKRIWVRSPRTSGRRPRQQVDPAGCGRPQDSGLPPGSCVCGVRCNCSLARITLPACATCMK